MPIGYHPSVYGDYLNALVLFGSITGEDPRTLTAELNPSDPGFANAAAAALGIAAPIANELALAAELTLQAGGPAAAPVPAPEPQSWPLLLGSLAATAALRKLPRVGQPR